MGEITVTTTLQARGPAAAIVLDDEQVAQLGEGAKTFPVTVTVGDHTWSGRVARMRGESLIGLSKAVRTAAGVEAGDVVQARIALDDGPREVDVPPALARALQGDDEAHKAFDGLAYTHRKEFARWVAEAKREETRERRVAQTLEMLREGKTRS